MAEEYVSLAEIKELLEKEKEDRGALSPEQGYALQHAAAFAVLSAETAQALIQELLKVDMMTPFTATKIADLLPTHSDDVRAVFAKERFSLAKEDIERVVEIVGKYL
jgi:DNA-directed RNA polymerase subunit F